VTEISVDYLINIVVCHNIYKKQHHPGYSCNDDNLGEKQQRLSLLVSSVLLCVVVIFAFVLVVAI